MKVRVSKRELETFASASLVGIVYMQALKQQVANPTKVTIEFETLSPEKVKKNHGPDNIVIPEHVPMTLCQDILTLLEHGWTVEVSEFHS